MGDAALNLDDELRTGADVIDLIACAGSAAELRLAYMLAGFAGDHVIEIVVLPAVPAYVDAAAILKQSFKARAICRAGICIASDIPPVALCPCGLGKSPVA